MTILLKVVLQRIVDLAQHGDVVPRVLRLQLFLEELSKGVLV